MSLSGISDAYKAEQNRLDQEAARQLVEIFPALNLKELDRTAPGWVYAVEGVASKHHAKSQTLASDVYTDVRREAGVRSRVSFVLPDIDGQKLRASLLWGGPGMGKRMMRDGGKIPDVATALFSQTTATTLRMGANGGRQMIAATAARDQATEGRYGFIRVPGPRPCGFCAQVAIQVYRSEDTAGGDFHDHDKCTAMPRIRDALPEGYAQRIDEWTDVYVENRAMKQNKYGREVVDAKQTARNMNRAMRERYGA